MTQRPLSSWSISITKAEPMGARTAASSSGGGYSVPHSTAAACVQTPWGVQVRTRVSTSNTRGWKGTSILVEHHVSGVQNFERLNVVSCSKPAVFIISTNQTLCDGSRTCLSLTAIQDAVSQAGVSGNYLLNVTNE